MLRINRVDNRGQITLKLEGKLFEPWVSELRTVALESSSEGQTLMLDLASVSFVDAAGIDLLNELIAGGAGIVACSNFVAEILHVEKP